MKEKRNIHLKVQELCDCYATNDPLKEMSEIKGDSDQDEAAAKWLALAALHGVTDNAKEVTIRRSSDGNIKVTAGIDITAKFDHNDAKEIRFRI